MIQPLVYQHKHAIDSPFEFTDALANIATAATGAFAIGSAVGGISGYLKSVREKTADLPLDDSAKMALESLARVEDDLNTIKASKSKEVVDSGVTQKVIDDLTGGEIVPVKLSTEARKDIIKERRQLYSALKKETSVEAKAEIQVKIDEVNVKLDRDIKSSEAAKTQSVNIKSNDDLIKEDVEILTQLNNKQQEVNQPSKVPGNYQEPKRQKATTGTITQRERAVIDRDGYTEDYDADIAAYKALENRRIIQDDEIVDADEFMKSIDDEIKGIDDVLRCAIG